MQLERVESGPAWADKTVTDYSDTSVTRARKWAEEQLLGGDADRTVTLWSEFIGTLNAQQAALFSILLCRKMSRESRMAALDLLIGEFLRDETVSKTIEEDGDEYLRVGA